MCNENDSTNGEFAAMHFWLERAVHSGERIEAKRVEELAKLNCCDGSAYAQAIVPEEH
jgi:hypothetical protein